MTTTKRWKKRLRTRGVAMVEAGILAPIFAMMMMMTIYLMGTYEAKYRSVMMSRYATWSYASNACSDDEFKPITDDLPLGIKAGSTGGTNDGAVTQKQDETGGAGTDKYTQGADDQAGASAGSSMFMAHGKASMTWDYSPTYKFNGSGAKTVMTESQAVCNTKPTGMNPISYIQNLAGQIF